MNHEAAQETLNRVFMCTCIYVENMIKKMREARRKIKLLKTQKKTHEQIE